MYRGFTEAQAKAHKKYVAQFKEIKIRVKPETGAAIKAAAAAQGISVNQFILQAINKAM